MGLLDSFADDRTEGHIDLSAQEEVVAKLRAQVSSLEGDIEDIQVVGELCARPCLFGRG